MKTKIITLASIFLFSTGCLFAQVDVNSGNVPCKITIDNSIETKEYIYKAAKAGDPSRKKVFVSNTDGQKLETTLYVWCNTRGWVASQKTEYKYNDENVLCKLVHQTWDDVRSVWINKQEQNI